jgi:hypothetical protein
VPRAWGAILELRHDRLDVVGRGARVLASIDTRSHALVPSATQRRGTEGDKAGAEDAGTSWLPLAAPTAFLLLLAAAARRRMLKNSAAEPITEVWEPPSDRHAPTG